MLKTILLSLAALSVAVGVGVAWAKHRGECTEGGPFGTITDRVASKLELSEPQRAKLDDFAQALRELRSGWRDRRSALREEIDGLLAAPALDRARAYQLVDERQQAFEERSHQLVDRFADFTDTLRPEQRTQLAELIGERMDRRWRHFGRDH